MDVVTKAEYTQKVCELENQISQLRSMIMPFVVAELDGEKVVDWRQACELTGLTPHGLADARRAGRIVTNIKLNGKEYGYKIKELDKYKKRYKNANQLL